MSRGDVQSFFEGRSGLSNPVSDDIDCGTYEFMKESFYYIVPYTKSCFCISVFNSEPSFFYQALISICIINQGMSGKRDFLKYLCSSR